jgi:hypothetical protein
MQVAEATVAALGQQHRLIGLDQLGQHRPVSRSVMMVPTGMRRVMSSAAAPKQSAPRPPSPLRAS